MGEQGNTSKEVMEFALNESKEDKETIVLKDVSLSASFISTEQDLLDLQDLIISYATLVLLERLSSRVD